jgi:hypothetical protein
MTTDAATTTDATTTTATTTTAAAPWHAGVDAETLGHWQNKGWKTEDPKEIAIAATKQAREAEKFFGVPADLLLKMPKAGAPPEDIKAFRMRLGMPGEAKDYDLSGVKDAAGQPIAAPLADTLRAAAHNAGLSKEAAAAIAGAVQKALDDTRAAESAVSTAKISEEKAKLKANWKPENYDFNLLKAMEGARRLGLSKDDPAGLEAINALENSIGYARVMEIFRKIGQGTSEDTFIERGATGGTVTTREGAVARKAELMADKAWGERLLKGGAAERAEWNSLNSMIEGAAA